VSLSSQSNTDNTGSTHSSERETGSQ